MDDPNNQIASNSDLGFYSLIDWMGIGVIELMTNSLQ